MLHIWIQHIFKPEFVWIWLNMCAGHGSGFRARHLANYAEQKTFSHRIEILKANTAPRACASGNERYWPPPRSRTHTDIYIYILYNMYVYSIQYTVYNIQYTIYICIHIYYIKDVYIYTLYVYISSLYVWRCVCLCQCARARVREWYLCDVMWCHVVSCNVIYCILMSCSIMQCQVISCNDM